MSRVRIVVAFILAVNLTAFAADSKTEPRRPNILLVLSDDQGYGDIGVQGMRDIPTPTLDSLAARGVRFTDGYVTAPVCSPSRAGLLTGRYQQRFGHEHNPGASRVAGLPRSERTMADTLHAAGYATGIVGKWHLGMTGGLHPMSRGFDEFFGFLHGAHDYFDAPPRRNWRDPLLRGRSPVTEDAYLTDAFGREAVAFVRRHAEHPWFLYLSFSAVHLPLMARPADLRRFAAIEDRKRRTYAAMLFAMDRAIGTVLAEIERLGLTKDTLVVFLSDNGGPTTQTTSRNTPLRGEKGQVYEGGIRVPFLVRWDGQIPAGRVIGRPVSALDVLPTALAAAGVPPGENARCDGVNLLPLLTGKSDVAPHEVLFFRKGAQSAVRWGNYKLVTRRGRTELFDLAKDIGETKDVATERPDIVGKIRALYADWEKDTVPARWIRKPFRQ